MHFRGRFWAIVAGATLCALLAGCPLFVFKNPPTARFTADVTEGYAPLTVRFTDQSLNGTAPITVWRWVVGITETSTDPSFDYTFPFPGTFSVTLTVTSADGTDDEVKKDYIQVLATAPPVAAFSADVTSGFVPLTVNFTNESTLGTGTEELSWLWEFGDGTTSDEEHPVHAYQTGRKYTVSLTVTTEHGKATETKGNFIDAQPLTPPAPEFSAAPTSGHDPLTVQFTDQTEPGTGTELAWSWDFGDGTTSTAQSPSHTYTKLGAFNVSLTATSEHGAATKTKPALVSVWNTARYFGGAAADRAHALVEAPDGGYVLAGETQSSGAGQRDIYLVHAGPDGNMVWSRTFGGPRDDFANALAAMPGGGYVLAGGTTNEAGDTDVFLVRTDPAGNRLWDRTYGGEANDYAAALTVTRDGGLLIAGVTQPSADANFDVYLLRTDAEGDVVWSRVIGGPDLEQANAVIETANGGFAIAGATTSLGNRDAMLLWIDAFGINSWARTYGGAGSDTARALVQTDDAGFLLAGGTSSFGEGSMDVYLVRTDAAGNEVWSRAFGGVAEERANAIVATANGDYVLAGYTASFGAGAYDAFLLKTDAAGEPLWENVFLTYGGAAADSANAVIETTAGGLALAGESASVGAGGFDAYLLRTDADGAVVQFP
ncbi:MAG TPA: PKD domain-containing protein [Candidatus Hydrogenedentes bacterium]|nr:PKD domain-containing protein [Candidatus Hydrogenedentota bacterium]